MTLRIDSLMGIIRKYAHFIMLNSDLRSKASYGFEVEMKLITFMLCSTFLSCSKGDVRINWSTVTKNGATLKTDDVVSVSGSGRLKVGFSH